jgi:hypothetical protein
MRQGRGCCMDRCRVVVSIAGSSHSWVLINSKKDYIDALMVSAQIQKNFNGQRSHIRVRIDPERVVVLEEVHNFVKL